MNKFKGQGLALKQFRKECGFTNQEVVDRVGKSPMWLSDIENGKSNLFFQRCQKVMPYIRSYFGRVFRTNR